MKLFTAISLFASLLVAQIEDEAKGKKPCCGTKEPSYDCGDGCGGCFKNYIQKMDFYHTKPVLLGNGKNWSFFQPTANYTADDGVFSFDCHGGYVNSGVFTHWVRPNPITQLDHYKFFIYADAAAEIPKNGDLVIEFDGSGETYNGDQNPFPKEITQLNDLRFAHAGFSTIDFEKGFAFDWLLTNDRVYVLYARYPLFWDSDVITPPNYATFTFAIPVKMRKPCDTHNMKTVFHGANKQVSYRLDGREVFRITKVGYLLDRQYMLIDQAGQEGPEFPERVSYGFGTFSMVDAYPACKRSDSCCDCKFPTVRQALTRTGDTAWLPEYNPLLGKNPAIGPLANAAVFWQANSNPALAIESDFIWGQGATLSISKLVVYQDLCAGRKC